MDTPQTRLEALAEKAAFSRRREKVHPAAIEQLDDRRERQVYLLTNGKRTMMMDAVDRDDFVTKERLEPVPTRSPERTECIAAGDLAPQALFGRHACPVVVDSPASCTVEPNMPPYPPLGSS